MARPCPRSPPRARNKLPTEVQILDRQIGLLQEELQSLEALQSVSRCCKEVHDFVGSNPDPLIPLYDPGSHSLFLEFLVVWIAYLCGFLSIRKKRKHKSRSMWEWLRAKLCFNFSCICCSCVCSLRLETLCCCSRHYPRTCCCNSGQIWWCRPHCLRPSFFSCPGCTCACIWSCCASCLEVRLCPTCTKPCCSKQCLC